MIRTLVVDDDYRVASLHADFVNRVAGFSVVGQAHTAADAMTAVREATPDLVLLDLYLPDEHGLVFVRRLQALPPPRPDIIVISAARDVDSVRTAMQLGAVHYIVKPFGIAVLEERLGSYRELRHNLAKLREASQADVDRIFGLARMTRGPRLPKGQSTETMMRVLRVVEESADELTAADIADQLGISRPTAQRYLTQLAEQGLVQLDLQYGGTGRPAHRYAASRGRR